MAHGSDDEQVEALQRWWKENGRSVIAGVVIAAVALLGWKQWTTYEREQAEAASDEYVAFLEQIQSESPDEGAVKRGEALIEEYGGTPYAPLTAFWLAQHHVKQDQLDQAAERLQWVVEHADTDAVEQVARLRLGRVLLAQEKYDQVLGLVPKSGEAFAAQYQELAGDALAAQGKADEAAGAYRKALAVEDLAPQHRSLIQLKLNDLGVAKEPVA